MPSEDKALAIRRQQVDEYIVQIGNRWPETVPGFKRFHSIALSAAMNDPNLRDCSMRSKLLALNECCMLGLVPDKNLGHVWLVPFNVKGPDGKYTKVVQLIPGYKGYIELGRRSGMLTTVEADVVYLNDHFIYRKGTDPVVEHIPWMVQGAEEAGPKVGAYCVSRIRDEANAVLEFMSVHQLQKIRDASLRRSHGTGPWRTDEEMMDRKTVIRRAAKVWPISPELGRILAHDDALQLNRVQEFEGAPEADEIEPRDEFDLLIDAEAESADDSPPDE